MRRGTGSGHDELSSPHPLSPGELAFPTTAGCESDFSVGSGLVGASFGVIYSCPVGCSSL